ncbi:hypothetical protein PR202_gb00247 [Eleusine coracana subsp. coracana]|uniref:F-box domain-containing protein n=1 Tax=Eleusine coracana subsp. coracana TaxID=191504 RepID=A0AAV5DSP2_ELECO|nr:hypothetical protein PR202_gb00247 [Eleusine coracana subsp. coracana]
MEPILRGPEARALPTLSDHLLEESLVRIDAPADLIRASTACKTFRRLTTDATFLRRYRSLHSPRLLGFVFPGSLDRYLPAEAPHPTRPLASRSPAPLISLSATSLTAGGLAGVTGTLAMAASL